MKKIIVLLLCLMGGSSLFAQENTVLGTGALSQASSLKYVIQNIEVANPSGYNRPTIDMGSHTVQWNYQYIDVGQYGVFVEGSFTSTTDLGSFVPSIIGGYGTGATLHMYFYDFDGTNYYYEVYSNSQGSGYVPEVTLSSSTGTNYQIYTYIDENGELFINYYDNNKTNLYTVAPMVSISFGGATATVVLEGTPANGQNTAIGYRALYSNSNGRENTAIGHQSLYNSTGNSNLGLGYFAGNTLTTGNNNVFIGKNAGKGITTGSGNLVIGNGYNMTLNNALNNSVIIADGNGTTRLFAGSTGTVKIGYGNDFTETNGSKLLVNGPITSNSSLTSQHLFLSGQLSFKSTTSSYYHDFMFYNPDPNTFSMRSVVDASNYPWVFSVNKPTASMTFYAPVKGVGAVNNNEFVTLGQLAKSHKAVDWITAPGADANIIAENTSSFTYSNNAPTTGPLTHFGNSGYGLQLNAAYGGNSSMYFRTRNGDGNWGWNSWRKLIYEDQNQNWDMNINGSAAKFSGVSGDFQWVQTDEPFRWIGTKSDGKMYRWHPDAAKAALMPTLQEVTSKGLATTNIISFNRSTNIGSSAIRFSTASTNDWFVGTNPLGENDANFSVYNYNLARTELIINSASGNVGIGITNPQEKLAVNGKIRAREVKVEPTNG